MITINRKNRITCAKVRVNDEEGSELTKLTLMFIFEGNSVHVSFHPDNSVLDESPIRWCIAGIDSALPGGQIKEGSEWECPQCGCRWGLAEITVQEAIGKHLHVCKNPKCNSGVGSGRPGMIPVSYKVLPVKEAQA